MNTKKSALTVLWTFLLFSLLTGCLTYKGYKGSTPNGTAILKISKSINMQLEEINGVTPIFDWNKSVYIPHGENDIKLTYRAEESIRKPQDGIVGVLGFTKGVKVEREYDWNIKFTASKSEKYMIYMSLSKNGVPRDAVPVILDLKTEKIVSKSYRLN